MATLLARVVAARDHMVNLLVARHHDEQELSWVSFYFR